MGLMQEVVSVKSKARPFSKSKLWTDTKTNTALPLHDYNIGITVGRVRISLPSAPKRGNIILADCGKMQLSRVGIIADVLWHQIPYHGQHIELGAFVVMPNHIHGILIKSQNDNDHGNNTDTVDGDGNVETGHALSLLQSPNEPATIGQQRFQNIGKNSISSIVGSYKSAVTKHANRLGLPFQWQTRFHDHIIRDDQSYQKISEYIVNNPANWQEDKFCN